MSDRIAPRYLTALVSALLLAGCAQELSEQDRARESSLREFERLTHAIGSYQGHVEAEGVRIPASLVISAQKNPDEGTDNPVLQGTLRLGLFGGVRVSSRHASFDFDTREIKVVFPSADPGAKIEIRGNLGDNRELRGVLNAPKTGNWELSLKEGGQDRFDSLSDRIWVLAVRQTDDALSHPLLHLKGTPDQVAAPAGFDLAEMPGLKASLSFPHLGQTPVEAVQVIYSALARILELRFENGTRLTFRNLGLSEEGPLADLEVVQGELIVGSSRISHVEARMPVGGENQVTRLPPDRFQGWFQANETAPAFPTVAYLEYTGLTSKNPLSFPFPLFPSLRIVTNVCKSRSGGGYELLKKSVMDLSSLDHLTGELVFSTPGTHQSHQLELRHPGDWSRLSGHFVSTGSGSAGARPRLTMESAPKIGYDGCSEL